MVFRCLTIELRKAHLLELRLPAATTAFKAQRAGLRHRGVLGAPVHAGAHEPQAAKAAPLATGHSTAPGEGPVEVSEHHGGGEVQQRRLLQWATGVPGEGQVHAEGVRRQGAPLQRIAA